MTSLTVRRLSEDTKKRLERQAERSGRSLEALVRAILDRAVQDVPDEPKARFPYDLLAVVEPGEDLEPLIAEGDETQAPVRL